MNDKDETMNDAIGWALRLPTADADAWRDFTAWLERSPANLAAYQRVAEADGQLEVAMSRAGELEAPRAPGPRRTGLWVGGAMAAAAAVALVVLVPPSREPDFYAIETVAGVHQSVSLRDGSEIAINGDSRITLDRNDRRFARLESGEALFTVATDPDEPFRVEAGGAEIRNIGTVFGVRAEPGEVAVAVAEGAVASTPPASRRGCRRVNGQPSTAPRSSAGRPTSPESAAGAKASSASCRRRWRMSHAISNAPAALRSAPIRRSPAAVSAATF